MLQGLTAPIHRGALKYYKESGLIKYLKPELIPAKYKKKYLKYLQ